MSDGLCDALRTTGLLRLPPGSSEASALAHLPEGYVLLNYRFCIRGVTLSTFHRDVTSSARVFQTKHPTYTVIRYCNQGPHLAYCPRSHRSFMGCTLPRWTRGAAGTVYVFDCDLVHAGCPTSDCNRVVEQFKAAHEDDVPRLMHLDGTDTVHTADRPIRMQRLLRTTSWLLHALHAETRAVALMQRPGKSTWVQRFLRWTGMYFYNETRTAR